MSVDRHEPFEELISASLAGDLTAEERDRLDAHLDTCAACRDTLAAFADQRRIMAGLRHVAPPRDLSARVQAGIADGRHSSAPWWRRPPAIFVGVGGGLAAVAGAVLALVLLNGTPDQPPVGEATLTPSPSSAMTPSIEPSQAPPAISASPVETVAPSVAATPAETPVPTATPSPSPEPEVFLALTGPIESPQLAVLDGTTGDEVTTADTPTGVPIAAELSPDGQWLAYITNVGESGMNDLFATRVSDAPSNDSEASPPIEFDVPVGQTISLGRSVAGSPFLEHLFWSADGRYLAYTLADPSGAGTDVWIFEPVTGEPARLTDVGNAYAGSWVPFSAGTSFLWVSTADETPRSHLLTFHADAGEITPGDPQDEALASAENVFQPLLSPDGELVIFWSGMMNRFGDEWNFSEGGAPWLAENADDGRGGYEFTDARELFGDVTVERDAFTSAAIAWGGDSDSFAVWDAAWTGLPQTDEGEYPDRARVYFGHAGDARGLTVAHAIDQGDVPDDSFVVDVKVGPTGRHLVVMAARPRAGVLDPPRADLRLVERNTGDVPDEVTTLGSADEGWFGPALYVPHPGE